MLPRHMVRRGDYRVIVDPLSGTILSYHKDDKTAQRIVAVGAVLIATEVLGFLVVFAWQIF